MGALLGQLIRERFMRRFVGLSRYPRAVAWLVVLMCIGLALAGVVFGHYLLSLELTWLTGLLMAATSFFIGTRLRGLNNIVHECCHSSFSENREDNVRIGRVCSALLTGCFRQYKDDHLSHHAHLGDYEHDHELAAIEKFRLHEPLSAKTIARHIVTPLLGRHLKMYSGINFSAGDGRAFFALKLTLLLAIAGMAVLEPLTTILFVLVPLFYVFPTLNFWTDCLDHAGLVGAADELEASRNVLAPAPVRLLLFPRNDCYHLVHHLFPQVPARHLKAAHDQLCEDKTYKSQHTAVRPAHLSIPGFALSDRARAGG